MTSFLPARNRFAILLGALAFLLISVSFVDTVSLLTHPTFSQVLVSGVFTLMLLSAVFAVSRRRSTARLAIGLAAPSIALQLLNLFLASDAVEIVQDSLGVLFLLFVVGVILHHLFTATRVTADTIFASVCIYLLLGVLWAIAYSITEIVRPDSFFFAYAAEDEVTALHFGAEHTAVAIYYSFVTMTTLGYGDLAPATPAARMLAVTQAITGQLYLAVLVARLVGLHIAHSMSARTAEPDDS